MKVLKITPWLEAEAENLEVNSQTEFTRRELEEHLAQNPSEGWRLPTQLEAAMLAELRRLGVGSILDVSALVYWTEYWLSGKLTDFACPTLLVSRNIPDSGYTFSRMPLDRHCRVRLVRDVNPARTDMEGDI